MAVIEQVSSIETAKASLTLAVIGLFLYPVGLAIYNLFFHPLRSYPGPLLWRLTDIPFDYHIVRGTLQHRICEIHKQYGPEVRIGVNELSFADSRAWKDVFAHRPEFPKDRRKLVMPPNGSHSILGAPAEEHARFRRLLAHAFSEKGLREQEPRIKKYMDLLVDRLNEKAIAKQATNIVDWYTATVFDVIGELAWGESFHGLEERRVHDWVSAILGNVKYVFQTVALRRHGLGRFSSWLMDPEVQRKRMENCKLSSELAEKRAQMGGEPRGDFWDRVLIKSADDNMTGEGMTQAEMVNNASVLVLGGAETSATTLSGTTYLLLKHPDKMKKAVQEVRSAFKSSDEIDVYSVNRLSYMSAVLEEAMRIYPPVPDQAQRTPPVGGGQVLGKWLPEEACIHVHQYSLNHSETNFHRADEFVPERWLPDAPAEFEKDDKYAFQPFSVAVRNCIGRNLAYAEMRLILAKVLYHFDVELDPSQTGDWFDQKSYGVWFKGPLQVRLKARADI
ncbi:Versicolorin B desaturase [Pseudocercospora fuligena]|uniref:Versicolorin B desaturase n=1 Tax=Pseudocercospora fuligena TaxID=685502 RepID=A0A8H6R9C6_9PEZI|nr:Versicolorin B desaturase [Pseudocercospora fuligena]